MRTSVFFRPFFWTMQKKGQEKFIIALRWSFKIVLGFSSYKDFAAAQF